MFTTSTVFAASGAQILRDVAILGEQPGRAVDDEEDEVRVAQRALGLIADLARERRHRRVAVLETAGVGELVAAAVVELDDVARGGRGSCPADRA